MSALRAKPSSAALLVHPPPCSPPSAATPVLDAAGGGYRAASMRRAAKAPDDWTPTLGDCVGVQNAAKGARVPGRRPNRSLPRAPCMQAAGGLEPARSPQRAIRSCAPQT